MTTINFVTCECKVSFNSEIEVITYHKRCDIHKDLNPQEAFEAALQLSRDNQPPKEWPPVRRAYFLIALRRAGLRATIEAALQQPGYEDAKDLYYEALEFKREDAMINGFAQQMGLTTEQVDALFDLGAQLQSQA